jgi:hypothetical protein
MIANARYQLAKALRDKQTPEEILSAIENLIDAKTTPPAAQPAPVPLTDEEIGNILPDDDTPMSLGEAFVKFARAIEAAHGITEKGQP